MRAVLRSVVETFHETSLQFHVAVFVHNALDVGWETWCSYEFHYAVNTNGTICYFVNEHIGGMHIFERKSIRNIIYSLPVPIVVKSLCCDHIINLLLCRQAETIHVRLGKNDAEQAVAVTRKSDHIHCSFRKKIIV